MSLSDATLPCIDCGQPFVFTVSEQMYYASRRLINAPSRCATCRAKHKAKREASRDVETSQSQWLTCRDCSAQFEFTGNEQQFYASRGLNTPTRCPNCRAANKAQPRGNTGTYTGQPRQMYDAICADCGIQTQVPFQPRPGRPIYCRSCYPAHGRTS